jgi:hypothetical protein
MRKEKKTALEIAAIIQERIGGRATIVVMRDHPINGRYAQAVASGNRMMAICAI